MSVPALWALTFAACSVHAAGLTASAETSAAVTAICPVTLVPEDSFSNEYLSTGLWPNGTVVFRPGGPGWVLEDGSLRMKWGWIRHVKGKLTIVGRRLDAPGPELRAWIPEGYGDIGFQSTALIFPTTGCWEVTGRIGEGSLKFVTLVIKSDQN